MTDANGRLLFHPVAARAGLLALVLFETDELAISHDPESGEQNLRSGAE
jgi:hypothetical protein